MDEYIDTVAVPQVRELLTNYGEYPDILWWDTPTDMTKDRALRLYHAAHSLRPNLIFNNRLGAGGPGDTETPEQHIPPQGYPGRDWETCMTMNTSWGFMRDDENWKSTRTLLRNLSDIVSKGGNYLLNVGPDAQGLIPQASIDRLTEIGAWMKLNGESIYGTTGSPFPQVFPWGRITQKADATGEGVALYLHVWEWPPAGGNLILPYLNQKPDRATVLTTGVPVDCAVTGDALVIRPSGPAPDRNISVLKLHFPKPLTLVHEGLPTAGADGVIRLSPLDATLNGNAYGNSRLVLTKSGFQITDWNDAGSWVGFRVRTPDEPKEREWEVMAEVAGYHARIDVTFGRTSITSDIPSTGGRDSWKTVSLGKIKLPAGNTEFGLRPPKQGWNGLDLRGITLTPR